MLLTKLGFKWRAPKNLDPRGFIQGIVSDMSRPGRTAIKNRGRGIRASTLGSEAGKPSLDRTAERYNAIINRPIRRAGNIKNSKNLGLLGKQNSINRLNHIVTRHP